MTANLNYLAGFFDGEGYIGVIFERSNKRYVLRATATNNDKKPVKMFLDKFGGNIRRKKIKEGLLPTWFWQTDGWEVLDFLKEIEPYLVTKKEQAQIALQFPMMLPGQRLTEVQQQKRFEIYETLKGLKEDINKHDIDDEGGIETLSTRQDVLRAIELYKTGLTQSEVAEIITQEFGKKVTYSNVGYWLRVLNLTKSHSDAHKAAWKNNPNAIRNRDECLKAAELYKSGLTGKEVAEQMGENENTVLYWMRVLGVSRSPKEAAMLLKQDSSSNGTLLKDRPDVQRAIELYQSNHTHIKIAEFLTKDFGKKYAYSNISYWFRTLGINKSRSDARSDSIEKQLGKIEDRQDYLQAKEMYLDKGFSTAQIADQLNVDPSTIQRWFRRTGIIRDYQQSQKVRRIREKN